MKSNAGSLKRSRKLTNFLLNSASGKGEGHLGKQSVRQSNKEIYSYHMTHKSYSRYLTKRNKNMFMQISFINHYS